MIAALLKAGVGRFGRRYDYDTSYMREIIDADAYAGIKLAVAAGFLRHDLGVPRPAYFAAKTRSTLRADCGSCLRLVMMMAAEQGVRTAELLPVFDRGVASADVALAIRYADAVLDNSPGLMEILADVDRHFGAGGPRLPAFSSASRPITRRHPRCSPSSTVRPLCCSRFPVSWILPCPSTSPRTA